VSWEVEPELTRIATNDGEFGFGCMGRFYVGRRFCSLQQVLFARDQPLRVAILFPGGVAVSRDGGKSWTPISSFQGGDPSIRTLRDLIAYPYSGYLDVEPDSGSFGLYLAMRGRGLIRIDGEF
jgi:hypothetical protein